MRTGFKQDAQYCKLTYSNSQAICVCCGTFAQYSESWQTWGQDLVKICLSGILTVTLLKPRAFIGCGELRIRLLIVNGFGMMCVTGRLKVPPATTAFGS